ncbi:MAG: isochorismate synthase [Candidatus Heimdallarchaeota archaeon]|nr:isochorismate synthase [Candidatus Heimdallarchaeota archaeon]MDH5646371.1 isochorismate synthase [Candidatus Heimdallarchaeota archaeon]
MVNQSIESMIGHGLYQQALDLINENYNTQSVEGLIYSSKIKELTGYFVESLDFAEIAYQQSMKENKPILVAKSIVVLSYAMWRLNRGDEILPVLNEEIEKYDVGDESQYNTVLGSLWNIHGLIHWKEKRLSVALKSFENAHNIRLRSDDKIALSYTLNNIGNTYLAMNMLEMAEDMFTQSMRIRTELQCIPGIAASHNSFGRLYTAYNDHIKANKEYQLSYELWKSIGNIQFIAKSLRYLALNYKQLDQSKLQIYVSTSNSLFQSIGNTIDLALNNSLFGEYYLQNKVYINQELSTQVFNVFDFLSTSDIYPKFIWWLGNTIKAGTGTFHTFSKSKDELKLEVRDVLDKFDLSFGNPIIFGGTSFFGEKTNDGWWDEFPENLFFIPKYQYEEVITDSSSFCRISHNIEIKTSQTTNFYDKGNITHWDNVPNQILSVQDNFTEEYWSGLFSELQSKFDANLDKIVLSRSKIIEMENPLRIKQLILSLKDNYPESYVFMVEVSKGCFFYGASPERLIKVTNSLVETMALAGTIKRGSSKEIDEELRMDLLSDLKNSKEHKIVIDHINSQLERSCTDIQIGTNTDIMSIRDMFHLKTTISANLLPNRNILDILFDLHPTPAVGSLPMDQLELIKTLEIGSRGWYASPIGIIDEHLNGEFCVAIRSAVVNQQKLKLFAGAGIVRESKSKSEWDEINLKFQPILRSIGGLV